jgi:5-methyltetrahydrofolate--homocysteine methyltransferase
MGLPIEEKETMESELQSLHDSVIAGKLAEVETGVQHALTAGIPTERILAEGLIAAMTEVGRRFECGEYYVPEMLIAARAMQAGLAVLRPQLVAAGIPTAGKVVLGSVRGDLHDIGKNLVGMMLEGAGFAVIDLGTDVSSERFAQAIREHEPKVVGLSALLTTTMKNMQATLKALEDLGVRDKVKVIVGGAPITAAFAEKIGADGYAPDASRAVALVKSLL